MKKLYIAAITTLSLNILLITLQHLLSRNGNDKEMSSGSTLSTVKVYFLKLIDKHFPNTNPLHKIFNRNTIKVSHSCLENVKSSISRHNKRIMRKAEPTKRANDLCNCRVPSREKVFNREYSVQGSNKNKER